MVSLRCHIGFTAKPKPCPGQGTHGKCAIPWPYRAMAVVRTGYGTLTGCGLTRICLRFCIIIFGLFFNRSTNYRLEGSDRPDLKAGTYKQRRHFQLWSSDTQKNGVKLPLNHLWKIITKSWRKKKKSETRFSRSALLLSFFYNRFCLLQFVKKLNLTKRGTLFRHFCASKMISIAHEH